MRPYGLPVPPALYTTEEEKTKEKEADTKLLQLVSPKWDNRPRARGGIENATRENGQSILLAFTKLMFS